MCQRELEMRKEVMGAKAAGPKENAVRSRRQERRTMEELVKEKTEEATERLIEGYCDDMIH